MATKEKRPMTEAVALVRELRELMWEMNCDNMDYCCGDCRTCKGVDSANSALDRLEALLSLEAVVALLDKEKNDADG